jgi:hypothetical protein
MILTWVGYVQTERFLLVRRPCTESRRNTKYFSGRQSKNYGCLHPPLINIPICNIVTDELHLLLRITRNLNSKLGIGTVVAPDVKFGGRGI